MEEGEDHYLTGNRIADGFLGFIAAQIALVAFWWASFGLSLLIMPLFTKDAVNGQVISGLFVAPVLAWILAMLLVRPLKRKYRAMGRVYQTTLIVYGILVFGGLGICLAILAFVK